MNFEPRNSGPQKSLRSKNGAPIDRGRNMMISGISSSSSVAFGQPTARAQAQPAGDQVSMSLSADTFSNLVSEAGQMPDVRGEVVDAFKARIQSGEYPSPQTLDGLADVMGDHWSQLGASGTSGS
jgi:anti-sigma28 factor (negative regulator of flagellin synthesis)